jgi:hypothetical protein
MMGMVDALCGYDPVGQSDNEGRDNAESLGAMRSSKDTRPTNRGVDGQEAG